jgi:putative molybdopterin biosynthesis protein
LNNQPLEEALENFMRFLSEEGALTAGTPETIPVEEALDRITAGPIYARISSPHYNASAMDGVAVLAAKTTGASETSPRQLKVDQDFVVVDTGDPIPPDFDAVIMIEDVNYPDNETIEIMAEASPWQHVRLMGEDIVAAEMILPGNHKIKPADIGGVLAGGITEIAVHARPKVALMPTGTELVQPGSELKPGDIIEYNTRVLAAMVRQWGGIPIRREITVDDYDLLKKTMLSAVEEADILLINAGSSAGREDFTSSLISELGVMVTHGVAIKPGKPTILGVIKGKPVIRVPGYPVSAILCMDLFLKPIIYRKQGLLPPPVAKTEAIVSRKLVSPLGLEEFVQVKLGRVGEKIIATPISRGAGVIMSMVQADGMLRVPRTSEGFNAAETVQVELHRPLDEVLETTVVIGSHDIAMDVRGD